MASIRKRVGKKGATYQVRFIDQTGKERWETFKKRKDAETFRTTHGVQVQAGTYQHRREAITVSKALDEWIAACERGRNGRLPVGRATLELYKNEANHISAMIGATKLNQLNPVSVKTFRDDLLNKYTRNHARGLLNTFKMAIHEAQSNGRILTDPCKSISIFSEEKIAKGDTTPQVKDVKKILDASTKMELREKVMAHTLAFTGLRMSELRGLSWEAVGNDETINVFQRADKFLEIGKCKTNNAYRKIKIPSEVNEMLDELRSQTNAPTGLIFGSSTGKPRTIQSIHRDFWNPLCLSAGVTVETETGLKPKFGPGKMRHFYASLVIHFGTPPKELEAIMGHTDAKLTLRIYAHMLDADVPIERVPRADRPAAMWRYVANSGQIETKPL